MVGRPLSSDERKAAEYAFKGYEPDATWSVSAKAIYEGMVGALVARALRQVDFPGELEKPGLIRRLPVGRADE
jgi:hypothetical protein